jgi:hypothetical protein
MVPGLMVMDKETSELRFAICIQNTDSEDLIVGKVYQVLADEAAARDDYIRVIDDSGEDYLYPAGYFVPIALPSEAERALTAVSLAALDMENH